MKKITLYSAMFASLVSIPMASHALTITWNDNTDPLPTYPGVLANDFFGGGTATTIPFTAGTEFRIIGLDSTIQVNGPKDVIFGGEQWVFDDVTGEMTDALGTGMTPGATVIGGSSAPTGDVGAFQNAFFFNTAFGFVVPTLGSSAGDMYGAATLTTTSDGFDILFPVLEAQWGNTYFTLGSATGGITFGCDVTGIDVVCIGEHVISASEDKGSAGFSGFKPQWELHGTISAVPVPAAAWLFGSGLLGLIGVARRKTDV